MTREDLDHMEWIYGRMKEVHGESPNLDYMLRMRKIIDSERNRFPTERPYVEGDVVTIADHNDMPFQVTITETVWDDLNGCWKYYFELEGEDMYVNEEEII